MRILIVDDETTVHEQLEALIPWEELGWEVIGHAYNGEEAKHQTEAKQPNLIITDLKMPLTDGLGFMQWLERSGYSSKVIVLSGYGEFEYSRSAFKLGAYDYILKPIQESDLLFVLSRAVEQIRKDSLIQANRINEMAVIEEGLILRQDEFLTQVFGACILDENEIIVQAEQLLVELPQSGYATAIIRFLDFEEQIRERFRGDRPTFYYGARNLLREIGGESMIISRNLNLANEFVVVHSLPGKQVSEMEPLLHKLQLSLASSLKIQSVIGVSSYKQRPGKLFTSYAEAQQALEALRQAEGNRLNFYERSSSPMPRAISKDEARWKEIGRLFDLLVETGSLRDNKRLLSKLEEAFSDVVSGRESVSETRNAVMEILYKMEGYSTTPEMRELSNETKASIQACQFQHSRDVMLKWTEQLIDQSMLNHRTKGGKPLIDVIKRYIDENYRTVSLDEISERFFINKNYFCMLFKNITGQNFMEYLTSFRMDLAKHLLRESNLKAYEIADHVGYADQRYFSQVFRKHTGLKPSEYRKTMPGNGE